jgi:hypothetical protein
MPGVAGFGLSYGLPPSPHRVRSAAEPIVFLSGGALPFLKPRQRGKRFLRDFVMKHGSVVICRVQTWMKKRNEHR